MKELIKRIYPVTLLLFSLGTFLLVSFVSFILGAYVFNSSGIMPNNIVTKVVINDPNDPYTEAKAKSYLKQLNVRYVNVALAQLKLESANATSKIFKENNNLFGMKEAEKRPTTALGTKHNHANYSHWRQSVLDYALWQAYVMNADNISDEGSWIDYINRSYSEIPGEYKRRLLVIKNSIESNNRL